MDYFQSVKGKPLEDIKDDPQFRADLLWFFSGDRYGYSPEKIKERGLDGLMSDFTEHMRFQESNELTAVLDLNHIKDNTGTSDQEREAWGRLMLAWDNAESGYGNGWTKAGDYIEAVGRAPSTWIGVLTAGIGAPMSKLTSKAASKGLQIMARKEAQTALARKVASESTAKAVLKGGALGAAPEAGLAYLQNNAMESAREEAAPGYERDPAKFWANVGLQSAVGFGFGSASRAFRVSKQNKAIELLQEHHLKQAAEKKAANDLATTVLSGKEDSVIATMVNDIYNGPKNPLDEEMVNLGMGIKRAASPDDPWIASMSPEVMKRLTASVVTLLDGVTVEPGMRITEVVGRGLADGSITSDAIRQVQNDFKLTGEQFGSLFVADFSQAGKTLNLASQLSRADKRVTTESLTRAFESLIRTDTVGVSEDELAMLATKAGSESKTRMEYLTSKAFLQDLDALRIGSFTSQPATTAANIVSSTARLFIDASDRVGENIINGRNPLKGAFSAFGGMTFNAEQADLLYLMMKEEAPQTVRSIFRYASRVEMDTNSNSLLSRYTRGINIFNSIADYNYKQAVFYSSVDRQLMDLNNETIGRSFREFSQKNSDLSNLPEGIIERAKDDALKFTFQYGYEGAEDVAGMAARNVIKLAKDAPFTVTLAVPFPRYVANQLEFIHDYTPVINLIGPTVEKITGRASGKTASQRLSRGVTGSMMFLEAYHVRASQEGNTEPLEVQANNGEIVSLERVGGPWNTMLVIADAVYRYKHNMDPPKIPVAPKGVGTTFFEAAEAATGVGFVGFNRPFLRTLEDSMNKGEWTADADDFLGDFVLGFTYPVAIVKDVMDQMDPDNSQNPYLREALRGENVNLLDPLESHSVAVMRGARALPDLSIIQYTQSMDGQHDISLYTPFNPRPVRTVDPITKQATGFTSTDAPTELQKEMARLDIKEWEAYSRKKVSNPTVDLLVRMSLAKTLSTQFEEVVLANEEYSSITDPKDRREILLNWINKRVLEEKDIKETQLDHMQTENPKLYSSYIRNAYDIFVNSSSQNPDKVTKRVTGGDYDTAESYIADSESIADELSRRQTVMYWMTLSEDSKDIFK